MVVTGHQINFLPGCSVMEKVRSADACIWMDAFQYVRHGFVNRNRFSDGSWMTVPVGEHDTFAPINRVHISDSTFRARKKIARTLEHKLGVEMAAPFVAELLKPYQLMIALNWQLLALLQAALGITTPAHFQTHLETGWHVPAPIVSENEDSLLPARERLAHMVEEIGGTVWLSGSSGRRYLDEAPFRERGIEVRYFDYAGPNPSAIELLRRKAPS